MMRAALLVLCVHLCVLCAAAAHRAALLAAYSAHVARGVVPAPTCPHTADTVADALAFLGVEAGDVGPTELAVAAATWPVVPHASGTDEMACIRAAAAGRAQLVLALLPRADVLRAVGARGIALIDALEQWHDLRADHMVAAVIGAMAASPLCPNWTGASAVYADLVAAAMCDAVQLIAASPCNVAPSAAALLALPDEGEKSATKCFSALAAAARPEEIKTALRFPGVTAAQERLYVLRLPAFEAAALAHERAELAAAAGLLRAGGVNFQRRLTPQGVAMRVGAAHSAAPGALLDAALAAGGEAAAAAAASAAAESGNAAVLFEALLKGGPDAAAAALVSAAANGRCVSFMLAAPFADPTHTSHSRGRLPHLLGPEVLVALYANDPRGWGTRAAALRADLASNLNQSSNARTAALRSSPDDATDASTHSRTPDGWLRLREPRSGTVAGTGPTRSTAPPIPAHSTSSSHSAERIVARASGSSDWVLPRTPGRQRPASSRALSRSPDEMLLADDLAAFSPFGDPWDDAMLFGGDATLGDFPETEGGPNPQSPSMAVEVIDETKAWREYLDAASLYEPHARALAASVSLSLACLVLHHAAMSSLTPPTDAEPWADAVVDALASLGPADDRGRVLAHAVAVPHAAALFSAVVLSASRRSPSALAILVSSLGSERVAATSRSGSA